MPLKRLEKARATLPEGYQYGDGARKITEPCEPCREYQPWPNPKFLVDGVSPCANCQYPPWVHPLR